MGKDQVDPEKVLPDAEEIAVGEGGLAPHRDVSTVGRAEVSRRKGGGRAVETYRNVSPRHERVIREHDISRLATDDRFIPMQTLRLRR